MDAQSDVTIFVFAFNAAKIGFSLHLLSLMAGFALLKDV